MNHVAERTHVLIAEDDDDVRRWLDGTLTRAGFATTTVASGREALAQLVDAGIRPDLMVLDLDMPGGGGMDVLTDARIATDTTAIPAIVVSGFADIDRRVAALEAGAVDFVPKPLDARELIARVRTHLRISSLAAQWRDGADRDPLTGLLNRRGFLGRLGDEVERVARTGEPLAVVFIDLDNFKDVNDRHGHLAGDRLLLQVATALDDCLGASSVLGRWGGDEFVVALPGASANVVDALSDRVHATLHRHLDADTVGASLGVAWLCPPDLSAGLDHLPMALIEAADRAMYDDKAARSGLYRLP
jgi:diguanylate cyclase (GGDEF)-like protein